MKRLLLNLLIPFFLLTSIQATSPNWGQTGHRVVGEIAQKHLSCKAKRKIKKILGGQSLAFVSTFADEIKSDKKYRTFSPWHYVNVPFGETYHDCEKSKKGDLVTGIAKCKEVIQDENASNTDKAFYLKMLVHLIGDLHQPLHNGRKEDKGGNTIQVEWFGKGTNLHRVWDSNMLDQYDMSYIELSKNTKKLSKLEIKNIQKGNVVSWVEETRLIAKKVYESAKVGEKLGYRYMYDHFGTVQEQLQKAGIRLAKELNELFG